MKKILVISVHPDDETLGCGGTLFKHQSKGAELFCVHVTNGNKEQALTIPKLELLFNFKKSIQLKFQENTLTDIPLSELITKLTEAITNIQPHYIYVPNRSDAHSDHRRVFEALIACTKSFRNPFIERILMCEVISETDFAPALCENTFIPNVFVDISDYIEKKNEVLKVFEKELLPSPYTRSLCAINALSRYRGSQINAQYAEAFMLIKEII
jgi:LmbE family N-acetylglucosaminyl deacetylase